MTWRVCRAVVGGAAVCVSVLLGGSQAQAQSAAAYERVFTALVRDWERATREYEDAKRRANLHARDTIRTGELAVISPSESASEVREAARAAWLHLSRVLRRDTILLRDRFIWAAPGPHRYRFVPPEGAFHVPRWSENGADEITHALVSTAGEVIVSDLSDVVRSWFGNRVELVDQDQAGLVWIYSELVTSPFQVVRDCYAGDLSRCRLAMMLRETRGSAGRWYTSQEARLLVERRVPQGGMWAACVEDGSDEACDEFLIQNGVPPPLSIAARRTLLQTALRLGGEGAYGRLVTSGAQSIQGRVVEVSGVSVDSLLAEWHASVMRSRPAPTTVTGAVGGIALIWIVAFAIMAARSTRWRLG